MVPSVIQRKGEQFNFSENNRNNSVFMSLDNCFDAGCYFKIS